ncbi:hypothetical protein NKG05_01540 [Oerskovia sp. M15]
MLAVGPTAALVLVSSSPWPHARTPGSWRPARRPARRAGERHLDDLSLTLDNCGFDVTFDAAPTQVVTIKSSTTEMMLALGLGDRIVGTAFPDGPVPEQWADAAAAVPAVVTPMADKVPGAEAVLTLEPDLVYAGGSRTSRPRARATVRPSSSSASGPTSRRRPARRRRTSRTR